MVGELRSHILVVVIDQSLSSVQLFATPWTAACQASLSFTISWSLLKLMFIELVKPPNYLILCLPFSFCPQSFPASGSFPKSQLFTSGGHNIGASASASVLPMNNQGWFPIWLAGLISLQSEGLSRVFSSTTLQKHQFLSTQSSLWSNSHICTWLLVKPYLWPYGPLLAKWCLLFFNTLPKFVIAFSPRNKCLLISWLKSLSTMILEPMKIQYVTASIFFSAFICHEVMMRWMWWS